MTDVGCYGDMPSSRFDYACSGKSILSHQILFTIISLFSYAVIAFGCASCPKITCGREGCGTEFCYHCKQLWHPNQTCDTARQQRAQHFRLRSFRSSSLSYSQESGAAGSPQIGATIQSSQINLTCSLALHIKGHL